MLLIPNSMANRAITCTYNCAENFNFLGGLWFTCYVGGCIHIFDFPDSLIPKKGPNPFFKNQEIELINYEAGTV